MFAQGFVEDGQGLLEPGLIVVLSQVFVEDGEGRDEVLLGLKGLCLWWVNTSKQTINLDKNTSCEESSTQPESGDDAKQQNPHHLQQKLETTLRSVQAPTIPDHLQQNPKQTSCAIQPPSLPDNLKLTTQPLLP